MTTHWGRGCSVAGLLTVTVMSATAAQTGRRWKAHDPDRPKPVKVTPGDTPTAPPSDAVILLDGRNLDAWVAKDGSAPKWVTRDGYMEAVPGAGPIMTRRGFGDAQLHVEWSNAPDGTGSGQNRGNSGVFLMSTYEVQVLDSYENVTYADGQAAAIYGQHPPLVNASRPAGAWQSYDIVFRRPRFGPAGRLVTAARMTVFHNGVLVHDAAAVWGPTNWLHYGQYTKHPDELPLMLQDHEHPVRFRNIWIRPLPDLPTDEEGLAESKPKVTLRPAELDRLVGRYGAGERVVAVVSRAGGTLVLKALGRTFNLVPETKTRFVLPQTAGTVDFAESNGTMTFRLFVAETVVEGTRLK